MKIGIVDTTFSKINMGKIAADELGTNYPGVRVERRTVPGIKDLPVACKLLLKECDICMALGMPGAKPIDRECASQASNGLIMAQLMMEKHILEVFVFEDEAKNEKELKLITEDRVRKHAHNAVALVKGGVLEKNAGKGLRQGKLKQKGMLFV